MEYKNYSYSDKSSIELLLETNDNEQIISAIIGAVNGIDDWEWLQKLCLDYINHSDYWVSKTAISSLGDVARIHHKLEKEKVVSHLKKIINEKLLGSVSSTIDDIDLFVK